MDHDYIQHENTGHPIYKYRVNRQEVAKFKYRMKTEDRFLEELTDKFSNQTEYHPYHILEPIAENCTAFRLWLEKEWEELSYALPT